MTTLLLLAHKMDRNPFGRCVSAVARTGLAGRSTAGISSGVAAGSLAA